MTRFARAKGSKASNERTPEQATSWAEMRQDLLNKNKEVNEKQQREESLKRRNENYQAFLQEKEIEEDSKVTWAEFQDVDRHNSSNKRKLNNKSPKKAEKKMKFESPIVNNTNGLISDESDSELNALKLKIEDILKKESKPTIHSESDSDSPPETAGVKEKPKDIIIKKVKKKNPKIEIILTGSKDGTKEDSDSKKDDIKENNKDVVLTDRDKKKIAKKKERYLKRLEKKRRVKQEKRNLKNEMQEPDALNNSTSMDRSIDSSNNKNLSDQDLLKTEKKRERRRRQIEKKKKFNESNLQKHKFSDAIDKSENSSNKNNLSEQDILKIKKKKDKKIRQIEKRQKFKEENLQKHEYSDKTGLQNSSNKNNLSGQDILQIGQMEKKRKFNEFSDKTSESENINIQKKNSTNFKINGKNKINIKEQRKVKNRDAKDHKRKKLASETVMINGKSVEIGFVDGFPVKKEDADRLKQLRREMITKGLPRSEIDAALKLERRRAEKALAREKKNVCFNCRMSGHVLSECPELGKDQVAQSSGTGICFKCGSTEHTHFECKVVKGLDYKFAQCFICNEQGHIARQCPDNQRGLYPKGGSCNVCGDVTHLKKDCPKYQAQQTQLKNSFNIGTLNNDNPDNLDIVDSNKISRSIKKPLNKIIKF